MVRTSTARKLSLSAKRINDHTFLWFQLVDFALLCGIHNQGYCHSVVSTMEFFLSAPSAAIAMSLVLNGDTLELNRI